MDEDELFVQIEKHVDANGQLQILTDVRSFMAIYVHRFLGSPANIKLRFVITPTQSESTAGKLALHVEADDLAAAIEIGKSDDCTQALRDLRLPIYARGGDTYIAGICAVCREIVSRQEDAAKRRQLLGFKGSCLLAPAEASIWTRFCEVNVMDALSEILLKKRIIDEVPAELPRFEHHMSEPVRMHNIYRLAREQANASTTGRKRSRVIIDCTTPKEQLAIKHRFAEGIAFTIADLILYPCFRLIFQHCPDMLEKFPLTQAWLKEIDSNEGACASTLVQLCGTLQPCALSAPLKIPVCATASLYKSDPKRYKPRNRIYTEQREVDAALAKLEQLQLNCSSDNATTYGGSNIDWHTIEPTHEESSALPRERLERKRQQLENMANAVVALAVSGDRIVDFCSGTGHLGLLLALQLPQCKVILMENKAISLERAKRRAIELQLTNCLFYQCNIDYFIGRFDVGASLHACGTATDIVLQQCLRARAKFVCCPCCYGSLQPMPHIKYPLSARFRVALNEKDLLHIAHTADQAHELGTPHCKPETTRQGQRCMDVVDTDRKLQAEEAGYQVLLTRLQPEQCTPKNRLLVGRVMA